MFFVSLCCFLHLVWDTKRVARWRWTSSKCTWVRRCAFVFYDCQCCCYSPVNIPLHASKGFVQALWVLEKWHSLVTTHPYKNFLFCLQWCVSVAPQSRNLSSISSSPVSQPCSLVAWCFPFKLESCNSRVPTWKFQLAFSEVWFLEILEHKLWPQQKTTVVA